MFRRLFGRSQSQPAGDTNDQNSDPETPDLDSDQGTDPEYPDGDGDQEMSDETPDDDGEQEPGPEDPDGDGDEEVNDETPDDDGDEEPDTEDSDDDGDKDPDPQDPEDGDQSDSSASSDDSEDGYPDDVSSVSSAASLPPYWDHPYPLNPPQSQGSSETDRPDADHPIRPNYISTNRPQSPEDGSSNREDLFGETAPQDVIFSDDETPQEDPQEPDSSQEGPPQEDAEGEDPSQEDPPQEEPSGVDIISLHSSDDEIEEIPTAPQPPDNNQPPDVPRVQCDWVPPVGGNYPGPGTEGIRCPNMSSPHIQVQPCDRGNHPLHANGGIRNICQHHRAKLIFEEAYLAWWRQFRPTYCKPCSLALTNLHGAAFNACTCAQTTYSIWRCMECSEQLRHHQLNTILTPARNALLARVRRKVRGRWVYQNVPGGRTRMACPTRGCYRKPWFRFHGHVVEQGGFPKESAPIGHRDAWYCCLGCGNDVKIPPREDQVPVFRNDNGNIVEQRARVVFPRLRP